MSQSNHYVGLDVSLKGTSICVIDDADKIVWRGQVDSTPAAIASAVKRHAPYAVRIGLESGQLSSWLFHELKEAGLPAGRNRSSGVLGNSCAPRPFLYSGTNGISDGIIQVCCRITTVFVVAMYYFSNGAIRYTSSFATCSCSCGVTSCASCYWGVLEYLCFFGATPCVACQRLHP